MVSAGVFQKKMSSIFTDEPNLCSSVRQTSLLGHSLNPLDAALRVQKLDETVISIADDDYLVCVEFIRPLWVIAYICPSCDENARWLKFVMVAEKSLQVFRGLGDNIGILSLSVKDVSSISSIDVTIEWRYYWILERELRIQEIGNICSK